MDGQKINAMSARIAILLSAIALLSVLSGYFQPQQHDEGTAAHIFQLSIAALVPVLLAFFATANWRRPLPSIRPLAIPGAVLVLAFGALYCLEHLR